MNWTRFWRHLKFRQAHAWWWKITIGLLMWILLFKGCAHAEMTASYYTRESCLAEGNSGICSNGEVMKNEKFTAASWFYDFGTVLKVTRLDTGRSVKVVVTDRGPNWRLVKKGRVIDLSYAAMYRLDGIREGVVPVRIERIR